MERIFNYQYTIHYDTVDWFHFTKYNEYVDETCYYYRVMSRLPDVIRKLKKDEYSRQALIVCNNNVNNACLISIQFQIDNNNLIVTANFRSQDQKLGRPYDTDMLKYFSTKVMRRLELNMFTIYVNVANLHERTEENPTGY